MSSLEIFAVIISLIGVTLTIKRNMWCWWFNFAAFLLYAYLFYTYLWSFIKERVYLRFFTESIAYALIIVIVIVFLRPVSQFIYFQF